MKGIFALIFLILIMIPEVIFAQEHHERYLISGVEKYNLGDYNAAIKDFEAANKIKESFDGYYSIGRSYHQLGQCSDALQNYVKAKDLTRKRDEKKLVETRISSLDDCLISGELELLCSPQESSVYVDGNEEAMHCGTFRLNVGDRRIMVVHGDKKITRVVQIQLNKKTRLFVSLDGKTEEEYLKASETRVSESSGSVQWVSLKEGINWVSMGVGIGGVAVTGLGLLLHIFSYKSVGDDDSNYYKRNNTLFYSGLIFEGVGLAMITTGIILGIADIRIKKKSSSMALEAGPSFNPDGGGGYFRVLF